MGVFDAAMLSRSYFRRHFPAGADGLIMIRADDDDVGRRAVEYGCRYFRLRCCATRHGADFRRRWVA